MTQVFKTPSVNTAAFCGTTGQRPREVRGGLTPDQAMEADAARLPADRQLVPEFHLKRRLSFSYRREKKKKKDAFGDSGCVFNLRRINEESGRRV